MKTLFNTDVAGLLYKILNDLDIDNHTIKEDSLKRLLLVLFIFHLEINNLFRKTFIKVTFIYIDNNNIVILANCFLIRKKYCLFLSNKPNDLKEFQKLIINLLFCLNKRSSVLFNKKLF